MGEVSLGALTHNLEAIREYVNRRKKAQIAAQNSFHREGNGTARRPEVAKALEKALRLFWRYLHGRGHCRSPERCAKADPGAHEFRAGRRIPAGGARPYAVIHRCEQLALLNRAAARRGGEKAVPFHLKIDTE